MATINDLPITNFSDLSDEELISLIKDVRARRRTPDPQTREACKKKAISKQKRGKAVALQKVDNMLEGISQEDAAKLLAQLKGE